VAQLGARMNGIHEVTGSIPVRSTNSFTLVQSLGHQNFLRILNLPQVADSPAGSGSSQ
jgi:hypothetical protein